jgi:hypothetical protein
METFERNITEILNPIFGRHPYQITVNKGKLCPEVTITYQDFFTPKTLYDILNTFYMLPVEWDIERTMSTSLRGKLLEELYTNPERLVAKPTYRSNVRFYVFDRFATTDFAASDT